MTKAEKTAQLKTLIGKTVNCDLIFNALCEAGNWKYDTEESDILLCFMRTWKEEGYIAKIILEDGISAPPDGDTDELAGFIIGKYNREEYINIPNISVDKATNDLLYYKQKFGDPNYALDLEEMTLEVVPDAVFDTLYAEIFDTLSTSVID